MVRARKTDSNKKPIKNRGKKDSNDFLTKFNSETVFGSWLLLDFTRFAVARLRDYELSKIKITPEQAAILQILVRRKGKSTISEIANAWMRRSHSVSTLVHRMEKQNLVKVHKYPGIKMLEVEISEKGKEYYSKLDRAPIESVFSVLSPEEIKQLTGYLRLLLERARDLLKKIES